jgi:hypothetical protein|nr:MAG TPA: hypothetical protein [Inoviridae sp.]
MEMSNVIEVLHNLYYGDHALIAWIITVSPAIAAVCVQIPAVIKSIKANKKK